MLMLQISPLHCAMTICRSIKSRFFEMAICIIILFCNLSFLSCSKKEEVSKEKFLESLYEPPAFYIQVITIDDLVKNSYEIEKANIRFTQRDDKEELIAALDLAFHHAAWLRFNDIRSKLEPKELTDDTIRALQNNIALLQVLAANKLGISLNENSIARLRTGMKPDEVDYIATEILGELTTNNEIDAAGILFWFSVCRFSMFYAFADTDIEDWKSYAWPRLQGHWDNIKACAKRVSLPFDNFKLEVILNDLLNAADKGDQKEASLKLTELQTELDVLFVSLLKKLPSYRKDGSFLADVLPSQMKYMSMWSQIAIMDQLNTLANSNRKDKADLSLILELAENYTDWYRAGHLRTLFATDEYGLLSKTLREETNQILKLARKIGLHFDDISIRTLRSGDITQSAELNHLSENIGSQFNDAIRVVIFSFTSARLGFIKDLSILELELWNKKEYGDYLTSRYCDPLYKTAQIKNLNLPTYRQTELFTITNGFFEAAAYKNPHAIAQQFVKFHNWCNIVFQAMVDDLQFNSR